MDKRSEKMQGMRMVWYEYMNGALGKRKLRNGVSVTHRRLTRFYK